MFDTIPLNVPLSCQPWLEIAADGLLILSLRPIFFNRGVLLTNPLMGDPITPQY